MPFPPGLVNSYTLVEGYTLADLTRWLLLGAVVVLLSLVAVRISARSGLPTMLLYLGIGLAFGDGGAGIAFDNAALTQVLGYAALILILAEGGLTTPWNGIRKAVFPAIVLSTVGVFVSIGVVAVACHLVLGLTWSMALLMGAILSSADAAAVFSVLRDVPLPTRLRGILEAESGFNDAPVVIITTAFALQLTEGDAPDPAWQLALLALVELGVGAVIGIAVGWLGGKAVRLLARGASGIFAIGVIAVPVLGYAVAASVHASGFIAAYLAALVLGNMRLPHRAAVNGFVQALGTIAQVGLFFLLGLLASPSRLPVEAWPALVIGLVLLVVARPLSVAASLTPFRVPWRDQLFVSWAGLRGAVPVVLATVPATLGATGTRWIFDFVFVLVLIYTLVQGPSLPWVARKLGVRRIGDPSAAVGRDHRPGSNGRRGRHGNHRPGLQAGGGGDLRVAAACRRECHARAARGRVVRARTGDPAAHRRRVAHRHPVGCRRCRARAAGGGEPGRAVGRVGARSS